MWISRRSVCVSELCPERRLSARDENQPVRDEVHWDGWGYRSTCRFCGTLVELEQA